MGRFNLGVASLLLAQLACSGLPPSTSTPIAAVTPTAAVGAPTPVSVETADTATATAIASPLPAESPTPEPTAAEPVLDLEILEWAEFPYANLADPSNTDTHVEVLIRNPNDFPVKVDTDSDELRFVDAAGDVAYANPSSVFSIWEGEWMLPGETAALSACVCFVSSGFEKKDWSTLELVAPLERYEDVDYTRDVEVTLGEFFSLADAHLGGDGLGAEITLTNTSDRVLESIPLRVLARDSEGRYVGVVTSGNAVASFTENIGIQPGDTANGVIVSEIDYVDIDIPLTYEVAAIGIPKR